MTEFGGALRQFFEERVQCVWVRLEGWVTNTARQQHPLGYKKCLKDAPCSKFPACLTQFSLNMGHPLLLLLGLGAHAQRQRMEAPFRNLPGAAGC